jgi:hypothetical protein
MNNPQYRPQGQSQPQGGQQRPQGSIPQHGSPASHTQQVVRETTTVTTKGENKIMKVIMSAKRSINGFTPFQVIIVVAGMLLITSVMLSLFGRRSTSRDVVRVPKPADVFERIPMEFTFPNTNVSVRLPDGKIIEYRIPKAVIYVDFIRPTTTVRVDD